MREPNEVTSSRSIFLLNSIRQIRPICHPCAGLLWKPRKPRPNPDRKERRNRQLKRWSGAHADLSNIHWELHHPSKERGKRGLESTKTDYNNKFHKHVIMIDQNTDPIYWLHVNILQILAGQKRPQWPHLIRENHGQISEWKRG